MSITTRTNRPSPTGHITANWHERYGVARLGIVVSPGRNSEFAVSLERHFGPGFTDVRTEDLRLSRDAATTLRDALSAALDWTATTNEAEG